MLRLLTALIGAPIVGAIVGAIAMAPFVTGAGPVVGFAVAYAVFGAALALALTLAIGVPIFLLVRHRGVQGLYIWFAAALATALVAVAVVQSGSLRRGMALSSWLTALASHNMVFGLVCAGTAAAIIWHICGSKSAA